MPSGSKIHLAIPFGGSFSAPLVSACLSIIRLEYIPIIPSNIYVIYLSKVAHHFQLWLGPGSISDEKL